MSIQEIWVKFKGDPDRHEWLTALLIVTVAFSAFFLGRLSVPNTTQQISKNSQSAQAITHEASAKKEVVPDRGMEVTGSVVSEKGYVASKNGTKYHLPWCSGAKRIKEENKVWFGTKEEAEAGGYTPAANCKGI